MFRRLTESLGRIRKRRRHYARFRDWFLDGYGRLLRRLPYLPLPGRGAVCYVRLRGQDHPFALRLGRTDFLVLDEIFGEGEYQPVADFLPAAKTIVDAGANAGLSIRYWHRLFPQVSVVAIEPDAGNLQILQRNVELIQAVNATHVCRACLVGSSRTVVLDASAGDWAISVASGGAAGPSVPGMTLPEILSAAGMTGQIDLLKCDIEGSEKEVFADCAAWISRIDNLVVEIHPGYAVQDFLADLQRNGAQMRIVSRIFKGSNLWVLLLTCRPA